MSYLPIIGLEVHAHLSTKTKMFCTSTQDPLEHHPNTTICPICMGHPGVLPTINKKAVESVIKLGIALGGEIQEFSRFDRKNYFYPDLPKGYQISQYKYPIVTGGNLAGVRITRIHLEEDAGKLIHGKGTSLIDFNRAGVPLMELVTEPDITSVKQAAEFAKELQLILRYLNVSNADMEKGQLRLEANISLKKTTDARLGTKVEVKNINSFRALVRALEYEIKRQNEVLSGGKKVVQETRGWDEEKQQTVSQRTKEEAHDYRYLPEPDLPPLKPYELFDLEQIKIQLPELPAGKRKRLIKEFEITEEETEILVHDKALATFFEQSVSELKEWLSTKGKSVESRQAISTLTNYLISDLQGLVKKSEGDFAELLFKPEHFAELIALVLENKISSRAAKEILEEMFETGEHPHTIVEQKGLRQVSDEGELETIAAKIIEQNPNPVADYKKGKENALQFLVGQVMRQTRGKANPEIIQELLRKLLR